MYALVFVGQYKRALYYRTIQSILPNTKHFFGGNTSALVLPYMRFGIAMHSNTHTHTHTYRQTDRQTDRKLLQIIAEMNV
jgi:hypothetical protein